MAESGGGGIKIRPFCTNTRCLFRRTCKEAQPLLEDEIPVPFYSRLDDIYCPDYESLLTKYELTDHTQEYLERKYKKYCIQKKRVI